MRCDIADRLPMPVLEQAVELFLYDTTCGPFTDPPERQLKLDLILERAGLRALPREPVGMHPAAKRAFDLNVAELNGLDEITVIQNPAQSKSAHAQVEHDSPPSYAAAPCHNPDVLPRRCEALERTRPFMPCERVFDGPR